MPLSWTFLDLINTGANDRQNDTPYMWAESNLYWYRGVQIAKTKGGDLFSAPELQPVRDESGSDALGKMMAQSSSLWT